MLHWLNYAFYFTSFPTEMVNCLKPYIISNIIIKMCDRSLIPPVIRIILINVHMVSVLTGTSSVTPGATFVDGRLRVLQLSIRGHQTCMWTAVWSPERGSRSKERMIAVPFKEVSENAFHCGKSKASIHQIKWNAENEQLFTVLLILHLPA